MSDSEQNDQLLEWNRLNIENTEQAFASALYQSTSENTASLDKFSTWLLAGTGATSALLITQIKAVIPFLTATGFKVCLWVLAASAISGLLARYKALRCTLQLHLQQRIKELMDPVFQKHNADEEKIKDYALKRQVQINTEINLQKVIQEFLKPLPWWIKLAVKWKTKRVEDDRQASHRMAFIAYLHQVRWVFWQSILFLVFMLIAAWYARAI
jgi:hypothetical protein